MSSYIKFMFNYLFQANDERGLEQLAKSAKMMDSQLEKSASLVDAEGDINININNNNIGHLLSTATSTAATTLMQSVAETMTNNLHQPSPPSLATSSFDAPESSYDGNNNNISDNNNNNDSESSVASLVQSVLYHVRGNCSVLVRVFASHLQATGASSAPGNTGRDKSGEVLITNSNNNNHNTNPTSFLPVKSFAELDSWLRSQQQLYGPNYLPANSTTTLPPSSSMISVTSTATDSTNSNSSSHLLNNLISDNLNNASRDDTWSHPLLVRKLDGSQEEADRQLELLECFNQIQLHDYYAQYDIFIGLRIASTFTILFIVFILFVIYKTGCRADQSPPSRKTSTSLSLNSNASTNTFNVSHPNRMLRSQLEPGGARSQVTLASQPSRWQTFSAAAGASGSGGYAGGVARSRDYN